MPEYVDPADSPEASDAWPSADRKLSAVNSRFGRRMEIRSFRWLTAKEI